MGPSMSSLGLDAPSLSLQRTEASDVKSPSRRHRVLASVRGQRKGCLHDAVR